MTAPRGTHATADGSFGRSAGNAAARGGLLVIIAVLIGLFLLRQGLDADGGVTSGDTENTTSGDTSGSEDSVPVDDGSEDGSSEEAAADAPSSTPSSTPSATLPPARPNAEIKIRVANAAEASPGIAGDAVSVLITKGFNALPPKNTLDEVGAIEASAIYYLPGWESEAVAVAEAFGVDPASTVSPATEETNSLVESMEDATILVILGGDGVIRGR
ncbi:MAG: LytR C-terminal domain-containing protein [Actinomycetia bacterium]|nr:LytR C-terminal domain-containing protein [Actinomycetes bacterium]